MAAFPNFVTNELFIQFADVNGDDYYNYDVSFDMYPTSQRGRQNILRDRLRGTCDHGVCTIPITVPSGGYTFALSGFRLYYLNGDHYISQIGVNRHGSRLDVILNDKNMDDSFGYDISIAWLPPRMVHSVGHTGGSDYDGQDIKEIPNRTVVISSFRFAYHKDDHKIKELGIVAKPGNVAVRFKDSNGMDRYSWAVNYVLLN